MTAPATLTRTRSAAAIRLDITPRAARQVRALLARDDRPDGHGLRLRVAASAGPPAGGGPEPAGGPEPVYLLSLSPALRDGDLVLPRHGFDVVVAGADAAVLDGVRIDFVESAQTSGFVIDRVSRRPGPPGPPPPGSSGPSGPPALIAAVEHALDGVRPALQGDGGDIRLVAVEGRTAWVALTGACSGCSSASVTLVQLVERAVTRAVPEIERVEPVG